MTSSAGFRRFGGFIARRYATYFLWLTRNSGPVHGAPRKTGKSQRLDASRSSERLGECIFAIFLIAFDAYSTCANSVFCA
jgi:hypothetical protein